MLTPQLIISVIITKTAGNWNAEIWTVNYHYNNHFGLDSLGTEKKSVAPKCGWPLFLDSLTTQGIFNLKDCSQIEGYGECSGEGQNITVEFADCKLHRTSFFHNPWLYADKHPEAMRVTEISGTIERQLGFVRLYASNKKEEVDTK